MAVKAKKPAAKNNQKKAPKGLRPPGNKKTGGKSFSKIAAEILTKTKGDREKATAKLKELGCPSASAIVGVQMRNLGFGSDKKKATTKSSKKEVKKTTKKESAKSGKKVNKKKDLEEDEDLEDEDLEDEDLEDEEEEEEEELEEEEEEDEF
jgi:RNA polymerase primary sigma factor